MHQAKRQLLKSSILIMIATLVSRVFGLVRMQVLNYFYSQETLDPFWAAYKIPNTLRELLAEGALSVAFIPVFTAILTKQGDEAADRLASSVLNLLSLFVLGVVLLGILFSPSFMPLYVSGFSADPVRTGLAVDLAILMLPFLLLASCGAVVMGILNGRRSFVVPAFAPVFFTIGMVVTVLILERSLGPHALGWGVLAGGLLQLLFQLPFLRRSGFRYRPLFAWRSEGVREVLRLMGPAALALGVVQLNQIFAPFFASFESGGTSALQNAILLVQMPQGVFAIAVSTALLPTLSAQAVNRDFAAFRSSMRDGLDLVFFFSIPAALLLVFFGPAIVDAIFNLGGKFGDGEREMTTRALAAYAPGLLGMGGTVLANRFFYGLKDMRTPFRLAVAGVVLNLAMNVAFHLAGAGFEYIALANSIAISVNFVLLLVFIQKKSGRLDWGTIALELGKLVLASSLMVLAAFLLDRLLVPSLPNTLGGRILRISGIFGAAGLTFAVAALLLRIREARALFGAVRNRLLRKRPPR